MIAPPSAVQAAERLPLPSGVLVSYGECPTIREAAGCAYVDPLRIGSGGYGDACRSLHSCIYLDTRDPFARYHELGHVWSERTLASADRAWFTWALGFPKGTPWRWSVPGLSPVEQVSNAYAACALGDDGTDWLGRSDARWTYAGVTRERLRAICHAIMIRRVAPWTAPHAPL